MLSLDMNGAKQQAMTSSAYGSGGAVPKNHGTASPLTHFNGGYRPHNRGQVQFGTAQQRDLDTPSEQEQLQGELQHHLLHQFSPFNAPHSSQPHASTSSHGLPGNALSVNSSVASSTEPFTTQNFDFAGLSGAPEATQDANNYYAHYLNESGLSDNADQQGSTSLSPFMPAMQSQNQSDMLQAFVSAMHAASLPAPPSESTELAESTIASPYSEGTESLANDKRKSARRQGVTCDQCRTKHLRCDLDDRRAEASRSSSREVAEMALLEMQKSSSTGTAVHHIRCTRCEDKGFVCTKTHAPPSRRYPRPSRSGKRIEQARALHGASSSDASTSMSSVERINASTILIRALTELRGAEVRITDRVMAGSLSIQLLNCFFAVCHMQAPVIDFAHFSKTFNAANGDPRKMSIMSNGGSVEEGIPSHIPSIQGMTSITWPDTKESKIGTPGSTETLLAVVHAWAAHYTDAPIAFGPDFKDLDTNSTRLLEVDDNGSVDMATPFDAADPDTVKTGAKRPKRKQGVACDTCRLRRVRCDVTERPDGMGCSRCEDKRIQCTDTYIQTKRAKLLAKGSKGGNVEGSGESFASEALSSEANRLSPRAWISDRSEGLMRSYRPGDIEHNLRYGKARKAFCHALLNHALSLVHKYDLLRKPSVESVQVLSLLSTLLDDVDGNQAHYFADTASRHAEKLGTSTKLVVDETNRHAVEHMLSTMQSHRIFLSTWCREAIASGLLRRKAHFKEDRAIEVVGQASISKDAVSVETARHGESRQGEVVLSGEMGLTFVIMTMVQVGALSKFLANHIDCPDGLEPSTPQWPHSSEASMAHIPRPSRFAARPSLAELQKLERACGAVWSSLDSLMLFFDRCASKAWSTMNSLQPFRPLGWIASTKLCGSLLYLAIFRALGERYKANAAYMATLSHTLGVYSAISEEDKAVASSLKALFDKSMQRSVVSCRKTARLIGILLPLGILQTGGPILKQIFPVAQFLAKIPSVSDEHVVSRIQGQPAYADDGLIAAAPSSDSAGFVDPQALQQVKPTGQLVEHDSRRGGLPHAQSEAARHPSMRAQIEVLRQLEGMHQLDLGPYTHSAKMSEVQSLIEGLSQLGYAWDTVDREIAVIQELLRTAKPASAAK